MACPVDREIYPFIRRFPDHALQPPLPRPGGGQPFASIVPFQRLGSKRRLIYRRNNFRGLNRVFRVDLISDVVAARWRLGLRYGYRSREPTDCKRTRCCLFANFCSTGRSVLLCSPHGLQSRTDLNIRYQIKRVVTRIQIIRSNKR